MISSNLLFGKLLTLLLLFVGVLPTVFGVTLSQPVREVEVVYILFGEMPPYLLINIELASRLNPVTLITDTVVAPWPRTQPHAHTQSQIEKDMSKQTPTSSSPSPSLSPSYPVKILPLKDYMSSAVSFAKIYVHMCKDRSAGRYKHELQNFQRWYVLYEYLLTQSHSQSVKGKGAGTESETRAGTGELTVFFGDGDTSVFADMNIAFTKTQRLSCDAIIVIPGTIHSLNWVATGCSSLWTLPALQDLTHFITDMYSNVEYLDILRLKAAPAPSMAHMGGGRSVVDMSLLWLWYVRSLGTSTSTGITGGRRGRPWHSLNPRFSDEEFRTRFDTALNYSQKLALPKRRSVANVEAGTGTERSSLRVCNALDVVNRTVYDHMRGWSDGSDATLPIVPSDIDGTSTSTTGDTAPAAAAAAAAAELGCTYGCPAITAAALVSGGFPEYTDDALIAAMHLSTRRLYLLTLHYQGETKTYIQYDICRVLLSTGHKSIVNSHVRVLCVDALKQGQLQRVVPGGKTIAIYPCLHHSMYHYKSNSDNNGGSQSLTGSGVSKKSAATTVCM